jgi:hypothetical protein
VDINKTSAMGFFDFIKRWSKRENDRTLERAEEESRMTPHERDVFEEDFEGRKADTEAREWFPGASTLGADEEDGA